MKVGDYVRTKTGRIFKITGSDIEFATELGSDGELPFDAKIISQNIIDLIEYGDIVKYKIDDEEFISEVWGEKNNYFVQNFDVPIDLKDLNITSIVTKEQFESVEYKI